MQCPKCGAILPANILYCGTCGAKMAVQEQLSTLPAHDVASESPGAYTDEQEQIPTIPALLPYSAPCGTPGDAHTDEQAQLSTIPVSLPYSAPCGNPGDAHTDEQAQLSTIPAAPGYLAPNVAHPAAPGRLAPPFAQPPSQSARLAPPAYPQGALPPSPPFPPPQQAPRPTSPPFPPPQAAYRAPAYPRPGRPVVPPYGITFSQWQGLSRGTLLLLGLMVIVLILGSLFIGIGIGQARNTGGQTQAATRTATPGPAQLYRQITVQTPAIVDSLLNGPSSLWSVEERPPGGCEFAADGLHVHIRELQHVFYCTSGRGIFSNFAFQIDMRILAGDGGGILFRGDTQAGNYYVLNVSPSGVWRIFLRQKDQTAAELGEGTAVPSYRSGLQQKNTLTVIARGIQMYLYINQQFATTVQDSTYTAGELGVLANETTVQTTVVYSNARIWRL
jgi:hypothetical protein